MDHPVPDSQEIGRPFDHRCLGGQAQDEPKPLLVIGDPLAAHGLLDLAGGFVDPVNMPALLFPNPVEEAGGDDGEIGSLEDLILNRTAFRVDHHDFQLPAPFSCCAWMAVIATVFTMSVTVAPRLRSFTGRLSPCMTGPMAAALADRWTAL